MIAADKLPDRTCESVQPLARCAALGSEVQTNTESDGGIAHHVSCLPPVRFCVCGCCCCALSCALLASCVKRRPSQERRNSGGEIGVNLSIRSIGSAAGCLLSLNLSIAMNPGATQAIGSRPERCQRRQPAVNKPHRLRSGRGGPKKVAMEPVQVMLAFQQ